MQPQISVIVPIHNTSQYLEQCMATLVNQTFRDIEIICVNDGSTDHSQEILEKFASSDKRIILLHRSCASGSAALPRNMGLERASGKYVIFLDSDDYFAETLLEKLYQYAEEWNADLVMCDNYTVSFQTNRIEDKDTELHVKYLPHKKIFSYQDIPDKIFQISNAAVWHKLILRELVEQYQLRFQQDVPSLDDIYFVNILLVRAKRIGVVGERLVYYRAVRPDAQTTRIETHKESIFHAFYALNQYLKRYGIYESVKVSLQNWTLATMAWWMHSISGYQAYSEMYDLYRNEYFLKLGLADMERSNLYDENLVSFYDSIMYRDFCPSLKILLETLLEPDSRVVIYGAGVVGKNIYNAVKEYGNHTVIMWCDQNARKLGNPLVSHPDTLRNAKFDAILIAIGKQEIVEEVKAYLKELGIDEEKIYRV